MTQTPNTALAAALDAGYARAETIIERGDIAEMNGMWARMLEQVERDVEALADALAEARGGRVAASHGRGETRDDTTI